MAPTTASWLRMGTVVADQQQAIASQFAVVHRLAALQDGLQVGEQWRVGEGFVRAGKEDLLRRRVDQINFAVGIDGNDALLQGVKHGLTLLKLGGNLLRLQPQQDALQTAYQAQVPSAQTSALNRMVNSTSQRLLAICSSTLLSEMPTTTTPICWCWSLNTGVNTRSAGASTPWLMAAFSFPCSVGRISPADKPLTDDRGIRMRIANTVHIGDDSVQ